MPRRMRIGRSATKPTGLIGHWRLDELGGIALDYSGSGNHGNIVGADWVAGQVGGALDFNGSSDYVSTPNITGLSEYSLLLWTKPVSDNTAVFGADNTPDAPREAAIIKRVGNTTVRCEVYVSGTGDFADYTCDFSDWEFISLTRNGNAVTAYLNGTVLGTITVGVGNTSFLNTRFGCHYFSGSNQEFSECTIDDVSIYNVALPAANILRIYNDSK